MSYSEFSLLTSNISKVDSEQKLLRKKKRIWLSITIIEDKINLYQEQRKDIQLILVYKKK